MKKDLPMTESMKIRHYIMDIIYHSPKQPVKLLSIRMMAEKFGVACSTVSLVLKKLEQEKFITAKHGIGNFTVPMEKAWSGQKPLIGIVIGYGRHFFYTHQTWHLLSWIGMGLTECGFNVRHVQLFGLSEEAVFEEVKNSYLDGLVWADSDEVTEHLLQNIEKSGLPVMTVNIRFAAINSICCGEGTAGEKIAGAVAKTMNRLVWEHDPRIEHLNLSGSR